MDFSKILPAIGSVAPLIAGLIGGPLASVGVSALESVFGLAPGTTATDGGTALTAAVASMTPENAIALATADADLQGKLAQANVDTEKLEVGDRASARAMAIATPADWTPRILAFLITFGFFGLIGFLASHTVPDASRDLINIMIGALGSAWIAVVGFYFGSSNSSNKKNDIIADAVKKSKSSR